MKDSGLGVVVTAVCYAAFKQWLGLFKLRNGQAQWSTVHGTAGGILEWGVPSGRQSGRAQHPGRLGKKMHILLAPCLGLSKGTSCGQVSLLSLFHFLHSTQMSTVRVRPCSSTKLPSESLPPCCQYHKTWLFMVLSGNGLLFLSFVTKDGKYISDHVLTLKDGYWLLECCTGEDSEVACEISRKGHCDLLVISVLGQVRREEACMLRIGHPWFLVLQLDGGFSIYCTSLNM